MNMRQIFNKDQKEFRGGVKRRGRNVYRERGVSQLKSGSPSKMLRFWQSTKRDKKKSLPSIFLEI